jgi:hypothetical protein
MDMEKLVEAIEAHSGMSRGEIIEAGKYGADAGWAEFTYTVDGARFYREHDELVDELAEDVADSFGVSVAEMVAGFIRSDMADTRDGRDCLMAWFALEEAGRWLADEA